LGAVVGRRTIWEASEKAERTLARWAWGREKVICEAPLVTRLATRGLKAVCSIRSQPIGQRRGPDPKALLKQANQGALRRGWEQTERVASTHPDDRYYLLLRIQGVAKPRSGRMLDEPLEACFDHAATHPAGRHAANQIQRRLQFPGQDWPKIRPWRRGPGPGFRRPLPEFNQSNAPRARNCSRLLEAMLNGRRVSKRCQTVLMLTALSQDF